MREELEKERTILGFYKKLVALSQIDLTSSDKFLEQAFIAMLMGHEFGNDRLCQRKNYEILLMWNLSYNSFIKDGNRSLDVLVYPFSEVDNKDYYKNLLTDDPLLLRELFFSCRLAEEIESHKSDSIGMMLLEGKSESSIKAFDKISKLKTIFRAGWIKRNVKSEYIENDATHIMQMIALASAYFELYAPEDLDYDKVMEMILIHEIGEVLAGDIPEGDKLHSSKHDLEARGVRETFDGLNSGDYFINLWEEFESRKSNEAKFVYELDKFDPIVKAEYLDEELGRKDLLPDFYEYEKKRGTFNDGKLKKVFRCLEEKLNNR